MQEEDGTFRHRKSPQARQFAKEHFELDVAAPEALNEFADKSFDVITLWHVMEHLEHLNENRETLKRILKDQGILIIACAQPYFIRCRKVQRNVGCLRCSPTLVAFQSLRHAAVWSQTRLYSLRDGIRCLWCVLRIYAEREVPEKCFPVHKRPDYRNGSMDCFTGQEETGAVPWFMYSEKNNQNYE